MDCLKSCLGSGSGWIRVIPWSKSKSRTQVLVTEIVGNTLVQAYLLHSHTYDPTLVGLAMLNIKSMLESIHSNEKS